MGSAWHSNRFSPPLRVLLAEDDAPFAAPERVGGDGPLPESVAPATGSAGPFPPPRRLRGKVSETGRRNPLNIRALFRLNRNGKLRWGAKGIDGEVNTGPELLEILPSCNGFIYLNNNDIMIFLGKIELPRGNGRKRSIPLSGIEIKGLPMFLCLASNLQEYSADFRC
jgi:hypothetical protein